MGNRTRGETTFAGLERVGSWVEFYVYRCYPFVSSVHVEAGTIICGWLVGVYPPRATIGGPTSYNMGGNWLSLFAYYNTMRIVYRPPQSRHHLNHFLVTITIPTIPATETSISSLAYFLYQGTSTALLSRKIVNVLGPTPLKYAVLLPPGSKSKGALASPLTLILKVSLLPPTFVALILPDHGSATPTSDGKFGLLSLPLSPTAKLLPTPYASSTTQGILPPQTYLSR